MVPGNGAGGATERPANTVDYTIPSGNTAGVYGWAVDSGTTSGNVQVAVVNPTNTAATFNIQAQATTVSGPNNYVKANEQVLTDSASGTAANLSQTGGISLGGSAVNQETGVWQSSATALPAPTITTQSGSTIAAENNLLVPAGTSILVTLSANSSIPAWVPPTYTQPSSWPTTVADQSCYESLNPATGALVSPAAYTTAPVINVGTDNSSNQQDTADWSSSTPGSLDTLLTSAYTSSVNLATAQGDSWPTEGTAIIATSSGNVEFSYTGFTSVPASGSTPEETKFTGCVPIANSPSGTVEAGNTVTLQPLSWYSTYSG